jgi:hypothetical protein
VRDRETHTWEKARAIPYNLGPGAELVQDCDADRLYLNSGPDTPGELFVSLDDTTAEVTLTTGFFAVLWRFRRLKLVNRGAAALSGVLFVSADPNFFVIDAGSGGGGGGGASSDIGLELRHESARFYPFSVIPPAAGSGGSTSVLQNPVVEVDTGAVVAASKTRQCVEQFNARQMWNTGGLTFWDRRQRVRCRVLPYTVLNGGDADASAGIQIGLALNHPLTVQDFIRLSMAFDSINGFFYRLQVSDGVGMTDVALTGVGAPAVGTAHELEFEFVPGDRVDAFVDGILGATVTTNLPAGAINRGAGIFVGEDASGLDRIAAAFVGLEAYTYVA